LGSRRIPESQKERGGKRLTRGRTGRRVKVS
jgi:hypothetical protein